MDAILACFSPTFRRERVFQPRVNPLDHYSELGVRDRYRLWPRTILALSETLDPYIGPKTHRSQSLTTEMKVCVGLRFLAVGGFAKNSSDFVPVIDPATHHRTLEQFLDVMSSEEIVGQFISFKKGMKQRKQEIFDIYGVYIC